MKKLFLTLALLASPCAAFSNVQEDWLDPRVLACMEGSKDADWVCARWKECLKNTTSTDWICKSNEVQKMKKIESKNLKNPLQKETTKVDNAPAQKMEAISKPEIVEVDWRDCLKNPTLDSSVCKTKAVKEKKIQKAKKEKRRQRAVEVLPVEKK